MFLIPVFSSVFKMKNIIAFLELYKKKNSRKVIANGKTLFYSPSLPPVSAGTGRDALCWTAALATALAVTVKAVCGTSRGISGTNRRPSMDHSEELLGPDILNKRENTATRVLNC
jgi:hypothetical protein